MRWALRFLLPLIALLVTACAEPGARFDPCRRPLLFGHRGALTQAPENTLPAFEYAMQNGADGVEIDVQLTADNELVAFHDLRTKRATGGKFDQAVASLRLEELRQINPCYEYCDDGAQARVPTVHEVVRSLPARTLLLFDLKGTGAAKAIVRFIQTHQLVHRAYVSSFRSSELRQVHHALPRVPLLYHMANLDQLDQAKWAGVTYVRVPKNDENNPDVIRTLFHAGFLPAVSSDKIQWGYGMSLVNDITRSFTLRTRRQPRGC